MFIAWHGDPCSRCEDRTRLGLVKRAATLHGMCPRCWLGASEVQRRDALWLEAVEMFADLEARFRLELDGFGMEAA
jgi:hypothetical protein